MSTDECSARLNINSGQSLKATVALLRKMIMLAAWQYDFSIAHGAIFADYEEVDLVTPEQYALLIREPNMRYFGSARP